MKSHGILEIVKVTGTVKNGAVAVDLPDGTAVTVEVLPSDYVIDDVGRIVMSEAEWEREIELAKTEAECGDVTPWKEAIEGIRRGSRTMAPSKRRTRR